MPDAPATPATLFPCQHRIVTTTLVLRLLVSRLDDFPRIAADLAPLVGSGGTAGYALVTDGIDGVLVNAEGYRYPRYRSVRFALHLCHSSAGTRRACSAPGRNATTPSGAS